MPQFPDTPEQTLILEAARSGTDNLIIQALAGAAKTSTLVRIAEVLAPRGRPILAIAFNKRIADELTKRLPSICVARTLNSIGHSAWGFHTGKRLSLNREKTADIIRTLNLSPTEQEELREVFGDVTALVAKAKLYGYIPDDLYAEATHLFDRETLEEALSDFEYDKLAWAYLDTILTRSIAAAFSGEIDYDDQLYMTTLFGAGLPKFPLTLVDEAQDLSPLNHAMVARLVGDRRLIAVGDRFQSIYGFRGAVSDSMSVLRSRFNMKEYYLSVSFRCPRAIVDFARVRAPLMRAADGAAPGKVTDLTADGVSWGPALLPKGAAVICRNNAPLFSLGLRLISRGVRVSIRGADISKRLIRILRSFGDTTMPQEELLRVLAQWYQAELAKGKLSEQSLAERYECLVVFAQAEQTLGGAIRAAERLFAAEGGTIELLSGHKSKGLEWPHVFHLDPWRIPSKFAKHPEAIEQEENLEYVITTRAKESLTFINLDGFNPDLPTAYETE